MIGNRSHRRGYVLVLTLGLIALTAISLAGLARYSLGLASQAHDAANELQRRWGLLSARHVFVERAAEILDAEVRPSEARTPPWPKPSSVLASFNLGTDKVTVVIADEDSKASLNTVYRRKPAQILPAIRHLSEDSSGLTIRLAPEKTGRSSLSSWGQVFDLANVPRDCDVPEAIREKTLQMTCWGSGRLNLRRAGDTALYEIASIALSAKDAGELVALRKNWGGQSIDDLLAQLDLRRPEHLAASRLFSAESRSYSLWVQIDSGQRRWSYEYVDDGGCFAW